MPWQVERARVAALSRSRTPEDPDLLDARRGLRYERAADYISELVSSAPPLTDEQRNRLASLLTSRVSAAA